ncbi:MAG: hypothetical protein AAGI63_19765 [Planctomycetota bacterium]
METNPYRPPEAEAETETLSPRPFSLADRAETSFGVIVFQVLFAIGIIIVVTFATVAVAAGLAWLIGKAF